MVKLFMASVKMQFRDKTALFWALVFPLLFVLVFGLFFGSGNRTVATLAVIDKSNPTVSNSNKFIKVLEDSQLFTIERQPAWTNQNAIDAINDSKIGYAIIIPEDFRFGAPGSPQKVRAIKADGNDQVNSAVESYFESLGYRLSGGKQALILVSKPDKKDPNAGAVTTSRDEVTYFDLVFAGVLCLALMNYNLVSFSTQLCEFREMKILKRLQTTPLKVNRFMGSQISSFLILNTLQIVVLLVVGLGIFKAHIYGNYAYVVLLLIFGAVLFLSIGFLISALSKSSQAANGFAVAVSILMMFLSGVFFPIENLPKWFYGIVRWLPLSPMVKAMRNVALNEQSLAAQWPYLLVMAAWLVVTLALTIKFFKFGSD